MHNSGVIGRACHTQMIIREYYCLPKGKDMRSYAHKFLLKHPLQGKYTGRAMNRTSINVTEVG